MSMIPSSILCEWRHAWRSPDLWLALWAETPTLDDEQLAQLAMGALGCPEAPQQVFDRIVERGEFSAARALLEHAGFKEALGGALESTIAGLQRRLGGAIGALRREVAVRVEGLRLRAVRRGVFDVQFERKLNEIETIAERSRIRAEGLLAGLASKTGEDPSGTESSLRSTSAALPPLPRWVFAEPPLRACEWLLDKSPAPRDFGPWRIAPTDAVAKQLIESLVAILMAPAECTQAQAACFTLALSKFLDLPAAEPLTVQNSAAGLQVRLWGLESWALPALAASRYPDGIPLLFATAALPAADATIEPRLELVLAMRELKSWPDHYLRITPVLIFQLLRIRSARREQFLRALGAQIPDRFSLPQPVPVDAEPLLGREAAVSALQTAGPIGALVGQSGIGKSALLTKVAGQYRSDGWQVAYERVSPGWLPSGSRGSQALLDRVAAALEKLRTASAVVGSAGGLVVIDGVVKHYVETPEELSYFLEELQRHSSAAAGRLRFLFDVDPGLLALLNAGSNVTIYQLEPLAADHMRAIACARLDMLGVATDDEVLDQIAYYCAGNPRLLYRLLQEIVERQGMHSGFRRRRLEPKDVLYAYMADSYSAALGEVALLPLTRLPMARLVLGSLIEYAHEDLGAYGVSVAEIEEWIDLCDHPLPHDEIVTSLKLLCQLGLLQWHEQMAGRHDGPGVQLGRTGIGHYLLRQLNEPSGYIESALTELRAQQG